MSTIMTIKETAQLSGLSQYAIRTGIKQGKIPACQLNDGNGKYLIDYEAFQSTFQNLCNQNIKKNQDYITSENNNIIGIRTNIRKLQV